MDGLKSTGARKPFADEPAYPAISDEWRREAGLFFARLPEPIRLELMETAAIGFETGLARAQQAYSRHWMAGVQVERGLSQTDIARWLGRNRAQVGRWLMGTTLDFDRFQAFYTRYAGRSGEDHPMRSRQLWSFSGYLSAAASIRTLMTSKRLIRFPIRDARLPALEAFLGLHFFHTSVLS